MIQLLRNRCAETIFLALAVWREARGESREAQEAVAMSILNRVERPSWWGKDVMGVVFKKWQVSSLTDPKDRQLVVWPSSGLVSWNLAMEIADDAISDKLQHPAPGADSYHDISIPPPKWATKENFVCQIGKLLFYNVDYDIERI